MDHKSRIKALQKLDAIDTKIGYDEQIKNDTYINEYYKDVGYLIFLTLFIKTLILLLNPK